MDNGTAISAIKTASQPDDPKFNVPPCRRRGIPLFTFRLIRILLCLFPFDAWVVFPLLFGLIWFIFVMAIALIRTEFTDVLFYSAVVFLFVVAILFWLNWARTHPQVPDPEDVARIPVQNPPGAPLPPMRGQLVAKGHSWFLDETGRRVLLRGINFSAGSKLPASPASQRETNIPATSEFYQYHNVSFVGRPFPLDEADLHLSRLRAMGLTFLRFLITCKKALELRGLHLLFFLDLPQFSLDF